MSSRTLGRLESVKEVLIRLLADFFNSLERLKQKRWHRGNILVLLPEFLFGQKDEGFYFLTGIKRRNANLNL